MLAYHLASGEQATSSKIVSQIVICMITENSLIKASVPKLSSVLYLFFFFLAENTYGTGIIKSLKNVIGTADRKYFLWDKHSWKIYFIQ